MSFPAHPCRVAVLVTLACGAFVLSAPLSHAELSGVVDAAVTESTDTAVIHTALSMISVPEPGILVSLFGGMGILLGLQRFRHRK